ncbi:intraflagellar transport protein 81 homolog [Culex quinquefasciatus]|uniref:intraflagellar transport protein 81 homolog n=1 Tax=Culex quinquefasciatus TaxID=7176 RepID=UPI0018E2B6CD|nr:intraflagellar transport protein 81 homolog [Culex quinquefasciatus]
MTEDLKLAVLEVNRLLETDYNLITFDSLAPESLLQVLVDVFQAFGAIEKLDVRENDPEETNAAVMEALRKIQYRPPGDIDDPGAFRRGLVRGEKKLIVPILRWTFDNRERVKKSSYLARFLIPLDLPPEAMSMPDLSSLWAQYLQTMDDFKDAHRGYEQSVHEGAQTRELRSDIGAIETEIENVKKRIERTQGRLDKVPQQELLLEAANSLRIEKERQKELLSQIEEQKQGLNRASMIHDRLQKDLHNAKMSVQGATPQNLLESIMEETQVIEFMVQQKLPQELMQRRSEVQTLQEVIDEPSISRNDLQELQVKIDELNREIQKHVEVRMAEYNTQNDTLGPFRQQAAMVARNKEAAAEQLDQITKELREIDKTLQDKQRQLQDTVGEVILRGEDLKQFVNTLRAKSNVYKQQRAELASVKAEVADLTQTLENLKTQDPSLSSTLSQVTDDESSLAGSIVSGFTGSEFDGSRPGSPGIGSRGMTELARLVDGSQRAVTGARDRVTPLSQQLRPLRERVIELKDEMDSKKQSYDALIATLNAESAGLQTKITDTEKAIKSLEQQWQELQLEFERSELLLEKANEEIVNQTTGSEASGGKSRVSLKETLAQQIFEQETIGKRLLEDRNLLQGNRDERQRQQEMWGDLRKLFECKIRCFQESKQRGPGGTLSVSRGGAETFTLQ